MSRPTWQPYAAQQHSTVTGTLRQLAGVQDANLPPRTVLVWLPPSYATSPQRYPVIYFHDGQNVFDDATSFSGEWHADEVLTELAAEGLEAIAVGVPNGGDDRRFYEYSPLPSADPELPLGGGGRDYVTYLADTVKPLVDAEFRTLPDAAQTTVIGSSMGGVISLQAVQQRPDVFGHAGLMSPAFWTNDGYSLEQTALLPAPSGRIWVDVGGKESDDPERAHAYWQDAAQFADLLRPRLGERLRFVSDPDAIHHETAWAKRLPAALRFLVWGQ